MRSLMGNKTARWVRAALRPLGLSAVTDCSARMAPAAYALVGHCQQHEPDRRDYQRRAGVGFQAEQYQDEGEEQLMMFLLLCY